MTQEEREFVNYVALYGKSYGTKEEYEFRANLFKQTMEFVKRENEKKENTFTVGINKFADWTPTEVKRLMGYRKSDNKKEYIQANQNEVSIPTSVDWRDEGAVNPIRDQGDCGSFWAFAAVGAIESRFKIAKGTLYSLSVQ